MANLVAVNIKRKDAEVASHGFSLFLDPKRIKLQDEAEIPEMMEEEEPLADADAGAAPVVVQVQPTMLMPPSPSPLQPTQGQEAAVLHDSTVSTESGSRSSEPALASEQAAPMAMDIEEDSWQCQPPPPPQPQPGQHPHFWSVSKTGNGLSGFF
ncbi:uncharacterized protein [Miscanthus floridulus]|uniref:uncharacterized protein n=1 Tax=Miscanthus floridulus TaxID=154761 RepID=UPI003457F510